MSTPAIPMFSILVPAFNRPFLLQQTIKSISISTFKDFELIVSDDFSQNSDLIKNLIFEFSFDFKFSFYQHSNNLGSVANKNFLLSKAIGKYCILIGDDDILLPTSLEELASHIRSTTFDVDIFGMGYNLIDENNKLIASFNLRNRLLIQNNSSFNTKILYEGVILPFWFFHPFTVCIRNKPDKLFYRDNIGIGYDFNYLFDCINNNGSILILPMVFFSWRKAQSNSEYQNLSNVEMSDIKSRIRIFKYFFLVNQYNHLLDDYDSKSHFESFICFTLLLNNYAKYQEIRDYILQELGNDYALIADNFKLCNSSKLSFYRWRLYHIYQSIRLVGLNVLLNFVKVYFDKLNYKKLK